MIISASRRTDIPAFYSKWLLKRLEAGYVMIPNPHNPNRIGRVALSPEHVDSIVFWTKNPAPMLDKLPRIEELGYPFYFQFTLTPYGKNVEQNLPPKAELLRTFAELGKRIGPERVVWRYDPVLIDESRTIDWHLKHFQQFCETLHPFTRRCVLSFIDPYGKIDGSFRAMLREEMIAVASDFSETAKKYGLALFTCAEEIDLEEYGIGHSSCIDRELIEPITGCGIAARKDPNQRPACRCIESVDIGAYDTCAHGCAYCYATSSRDSALRCVKNHDPDAPMLTGYPEGGEIITDRTIPSQKVNQLRLF